MFHFVQIAGDAFAVLCAVAILPWILGVPGDPGPPGQESNYARGWMMGLYVILIYPLVWLFDVAAVWGVRWLADAAVQIYWENAIKSFGAFAFLLALVRLGWAFKILSKS